MPKTLRTKPARVAAMPLALLILGSGIAQNGPNSVTSGTKEFRKSVLVSGLAGPWELTWGPDNMLWVTERTGKRITRIDPASGQLSVAITIDEVSAPGSQDGLLGMALHPELLLETGNNYVYAAYTYLDPKKGTNQFFPDPKSPYHYLYSKIVRLRYDKTNGTLSNPLELISGLPVGDDHISGRLKIGPDRKLYFTVGDEGHNQATNACFPIESQRLPTQDEVDRTVYAAYAGKSLRLNLDGSIPADNPKLAGVVSHVYTYGHRNAQGIDFASDGTLYSSEQGPKTDDEVNILKPGANYGWPHVAGMKDNKAYEYARWPDSSTPCSQLTYTFSNAIPSSLPREPESAFKQPFEEPIATMFTVPTGFNLENPACKGVDVLCWPTVGASSIEYYASQGKGIPGWDKVLLVTTLKRGSLYVLPLTADGKAAASHFSRYFQSENRYRDTAVSPDGKTIYIATDPGGLAEALDGRVAEKMQNPGAILAFTYVGERSGKPNVVSRNAASQTKVTTGPSPITGSADGEPPQFTAAQAAAGETAYNSKCAVCHGNTLTNGGYGPTLAGENFRNKWAGKTVRAFYEHTETMPPSAPRSLSDDTYVNIVAYILQVNGLKAGNVRLPARVDALDAMTLR